jgi:hypothetical protein
MMGTNGKFINKKNIVMKKQIISIAILFCLVIANMQAQQWSGLNNTTGNIIRTGNVGINVASPAKKLHVGGGLRVENEVSVGGAHVFEVDAPGIVGGRFKINTNGNVGINAPNPTAKFEVNLLNNNGWAGNSKAARFLSPDNNFFMDLNTYVVESGNVGYQFSPNNTTGMCITTEGKVGINESNPTLKFQVNGGDGLALGLGGSGTGEGFGSRRSEGENRFGLDFYAAFEKRMSITQGGYVGIGTASPERKLHLAGGNLRLDRGFAIEFGRQLDQYSAEPTMMWDDPTNSRLIIRPGGGWANGEFSDVGKMEVWGEVLLNSGTTPILRFGDAGSGEYISCSRFGSAYSYHNSFGLDFSTAFQKRLSITQGGKVGIGINNPDQMPGNYLLYVAQGIMTEKVKVALRSTGDWADYVFADGYQLRSLEEVEQFVKENKHLPGVPSAEEVHQSGIDVAAMDAKLLEKIEELTLYMIELKKENQALRQEVEEIKKGRE